MVTVKQFKEAGFDILDIDMCRTFSSWGKFEYQYLSPTNYDSALVIDELAWRKNTGDQPVGDNCHIEVEQADGLLDEGFAFEFDWTINGVCSDIIKWIPRLDVLGIEMNDNQETKTALNYAQHEWEQDTCVKCGDKDYLSPDAVCSESKLNSGIENYSDNCDVERELKESDEVIWEDGEELFIAQINTLAGVSSKRYYVREFWCNSLHQQEYVKCGIAFKKKEDAENKTMELLGIETPEQKAARERMESAYDLYISCGIQTKNVSFDSFKKETPNAWLDIVDKTGYRK